MSEQLHLWPEETAGGRIAWSLSRDKRLRDCLRKYYLQHYLSRAGGKPTATPLGRELYLLKYLRNRHMWVGEVVHELIELAVGAWRRGDSVPPEALVERGTRRMRAQYAESVQGLYRERPRQACGLTEHEYDEQVTREEWQAQRDRMERCVRNFFALELTAAIRTTPAWRFLALESSGSFELDGATVLVKPDLSWRGDDDRVHLVDWKTGKSRVDEDSLQLAVYALYARHAWGAGAEPLAGWLAYLDGAEVHQAPIDGEALSRAEAAIRTSVAEMRRLAAEVREQDPDPPAFPMTEERGTCRACNFRRVCGRG